MATSNPLQPSAPGKCIKCASKVPIICFFTNLTLAIFKMSVGWLTYSRSLFADGIHSLCDVIGSIGVIISLKIAGKAPDEDYPYGRGKAEFISSTFVYLILFVMSVLILWSSVKHIIQGDLKTPNILSLYSAVISVFANLIIFRLAMCAGTAVNSPAIIADANENKADMISSAAVVVGVAGCHLGYIYSDALAAIMVGLIIMHTAVTLGWKAIKHLVDTSIPEESIRLINGKILTVEQVKQVSYIKSRRTGHSYHVDVEIVISALLPVREGDAIAQAVKDRIMSISNKISNVVVITTCEEPNAKEKAKFEHSKSKRMAFSG